MRSRKREELFRSHFINTAVEKRILSNRRPSDLRFASVFDFALFLLAKKLSGIVYAPEDGVYDENLQRIYNLGIPVNIG